MASFAMEEFVGDGVLSELIPKFAAAGWEDVPTLKMMSAEDMDLLKLTQQQKEALELRTYLHDRSLMHYADKMEASKRTLSELLTTTAMSLSSQFGMKKGHVSRFLNSQNSCGIPLPSSYFHPASEENRNDQACNGRRENDSDRGSLHRLKSHLKLNPDYDASTAKAVLDLKLNEGHVFKGIVASKPAEPRLFGCIQPPHVVEDVASHSALGSIAVQKLTPEYRVGVQRLLENKAPPMKASDLWSEKATILLCIRRPGCIMCRAEAHQLYSRKAIFDALGVKLVAVLHEQIESEVREFWPRYWGGIIVIDQTMGFFKALGGGKLLKEGILTGFILNSHARANYKAAKATGFDQNSKGEGGIKGGMFIIRSGRGGVAYQFIERNFGDWAPIGEVIEICTRIKNGSEAYGK